MENKNVLYFGTDTGFTRVRVLGDPHLGRSFRTGVPLSRQGEREASVWDSFRDSLSADDFDIHVCMGDIFDKYTVPSAVLLATAKHYIKAGLASPEKQFYIIQGNHDLSRDEDKASSLDVLDVILSTIPNVIVVKEPLLVNRSKQNFLFIPYHAHKQGGQVIREALEFLETADVDFIDAAFGHWDIDTFGGTRPHNLIDVNLLGNYTDTIVTGHVHQPEVRKIPHEQGEVTLIVTGSMQPYSFAEDPTGELYVTFTLDQLLGIPAVTLRDNCVRVLLKPGEELPELDCLQLVPKFVTEEGEDEDGIEVELIDFNMENLLKESLLEAAVGQAVTDEVLSIYTNLREVAA